MQIVDPVVLIQHVLAGQDLSDNLLNADTNARTMKNALVFTLVSTTSAPIHVLEHVALTPCVELSTTTQYVSAWKVMKEIHLEAVQEFQFGKLHQRILVLSVVQMLIANGKVTLDTVSVIRNTLEILMWLANLSVSKILIA